jgi:DNA-binding beta-propeller fold protein YncE
MIAGCGGPLQQTVGAVPQSRVLSTYPEATRSWMLPEAKSDDLVYATNSDTGKVYVISYPQGKLVGTISGLDEPQGDCVDALGDVWITNESSNSLLEYAHGGTAPIGALQEGANSEPLNCAVDPTTGNLAVVNRYPTTVAVFANATGSPMTYQLDGFSDWASCAYDANGNLFANDWANSRAIAELSRGSSALTSIALKQHFYSGSIQWDGSHISLRVVPQRHRGGPTDIVRLQIRNGAGSIVGTTSLDDRNNQPAVLVAQFSVALGAIIGPDRDGARGWSLNFWKYPSGGQPKRVIPKIGRINGTAISTAQRRV